MVQYVIKRDGDYKPYESFKIVDAIKKGQILASLDPIEIQSQIQMSKIGLEKAERDLQRVKNLYLETNNQVPETKMPVKRLWVIRR